jgi:hypothetical protein
MLIGRCRQGFWLRSCAIRLRTKLRKLIGTHRQSPISLSEKRCPFWILFTQQAVIQNPFISKHHNADTTQLGVINGREQSFVIARDQHGFARLPFRKPLKIALEELPGFFTLARCSHDLFIHQQAIGTIGVPVEPPQTQIQSCITRKPSQNAQKISPVNLRLSARLAVSVNQPSCEAVVNQRDA